MSRKLPGEAEAIENVLTALTVVESAMNHDSETLDLLHDLHSSEKIENGLIPIVLILAMHVAKSTESSPEEVLRVLRQSFIEKSATDEN
jgi:hypothetical protein